jgi:hypothetical protein
MERPGEEDLRATRLADLTGAEPEFAHDSPTNVLIRHYRRLKKI